jgi:hypothetical protein
MGEQEWNATKSMALPPTKTKNRAPRPARKNVAPPAAFFPEKRMGGARNVVLEASWRP